MFKSMVVISRFNDFKPRIVSALLSLNEGNYEIAESVFSELSDKVNDLKENDKENTEIVLNEYYILRAYINFLTYYSRTWKLILKAEFSASWDSLQDSINYFRDVKKFSNNPTVRYIEFFEDQLISLEELYPYGLFFSIGAVVDCFECSICGQDIDSLDCKHQKGELYSGNMAVGIAKNIEKLDHVSLVTHPMDKRCVVKYEDDGEQFNALRYLFNLLKDKKLKPLYFGKLEHSTRRITNPEYVKQGRNDECFCGSGKKFKKCCINKQLVDGKHLQIISTPVCVESIMA